MSKWFEDTSGVGVRGRTYSKKKISLKKPIGSVPSRKISVPSRKISVPSRKISVPKKLTNKEHRVDINSEERKRLESDLRINLGKFKRIKLGKLKTEARLQVYKQEEIEKLKKDKLFNPVSYNFPKRVELTSNMLKPVNIRKKAALDNLRNKSFNYR